MNRRIPADIFGILFYPWVDRTNNSCKADFNSSGKWFEILPKSANMVFDLVVCKLWTAFVIYKPFSLRDFYFLLFCFNYNNMVHFILPKMKNVIHLDPKIMG